MQSPSRKSHKGAIIDKQGNKEQARQGDIFFKVVAQPPAQTKKHGTSVLAYGEVTGHSHTIKTPKFSELDSVVDPDGNIYVRSNSEPIEVGHEEHGTVTLDPGQWWCISRQREFDPVSENRRIVAD